MAVQKSKKSRSKRGSRRAHHALPDAMAVSSDPVSGERHRRHHVSKEGFYKGEQVVERKIKSEDNEEAEDGDEQN